MLETLIILCMVRFMLNLQLSVAEENPKFECYVCDGKLHDFCNNYPQKAKRVQCYDNKSLFSNCVIYSRIYQESKFITRSCDNMHRNCKSIKELLPEIDNCRMCKSNLCNKAVHVRSVNIILLILFGCIIKL